MFIQISVQKISKIHKHTFMEPGYNFYCTEFLNKLSIKKNQSYIQTQEKLLQSNLKYAFVTALKPLILTLVVFVIFKLVSHI